MCARFFVDDEVMEMVSEITASQDAGVADLRHGDVRPSGQAPIITGKQNDLRTDVMVWGYPGLTGKVLSSTPGPKAPQRKPCSGTVSCAAAAWSLPNTSTSGTPPRTRSPSGAPASRSCIWPASMTVLRA